MFIIMSISISNKQFQQQNSQPRVAVSACLLGQRVRYDGNQKQHAFVCQQLQKWLNLEAICPEVEIGMGVPRPAIQLVEMAGHIKAVGVEQAGLDVTQQLNCFGRKTAQQLSDLDAYIFKARSPSCGVASTPIKHSDGRCKRGAGLFAAQIMRQLPLLPVVEESKLETFAQQLNFLQRVAAHQRWRGLVQQFPSWAELMRFHHLNRLLLMAHGVEGLRNLDSWLTRFAKNGRVSKKLLQGYGQQYMAQFTRLATRRRQISVLQRTARLLRPVITVKQYSSLQDLIKKYSQAGCSLFKVVSRLQKFQRVATLPELEGQSYFDQEIKFSCFIYENQ